MDFYLGFLSLLVVCIISIEFAVALVLLGKFYDTVNLALEKGKPLRWWLWQLLWTVAQAYLVGELIMFLSQNYWDRETTYSHSVLLSFLMGVSLWDL